MEKSTDLWVEIVDGFDRSLNIAKMDIILDLVSLYDNFMVFQRFQIGLLGKLVGCRRITFRGQIVKNKGVYITIDKKRCQQGHLQGSMKYEHTMMCIAEERLKSEAQKTSFSARNSRRDSHLFENHHEKPDKRKSKCLFKGEMCSTYLFEGRASSTRRSKACCEGVVVDAVEEVCFQNKAVAP